MNDKSYFWLDPNEIIGVRGEDAGVYVVILCLIHMDGGSVENDPAVLTERGSLDSVASTKRSLKRLIAKGKLRIEDGRLRSPFLEADHGRS